MASMTASETIEAQGHLIDSGLLSAIFDKIIEHKSAYEILKFDIGRTNDDVSSIEMRITAPEQAALEDLLQQLTTCGCAANGWRWKSNGWTPSSSSRATVPGAASCATSGPVMRSSAATTASAS